MGAETVTVIVEQRGGISTNPGGLVPETSTPIEQTSSTSTSSSPIHQLSDTSTAGGTGNDSFSRPILLLAEAVFDKEQIAPDNSFIEQKNTSRSLDGSDSPIEQQEVTTSEERMEQRNLSRAAVGDEPIEQKPEISTVVSLEQFDFVLSIFPPCNSIKNPVDTNILWSIQDFGFLFDVETLIFKVNGLQVQDSSNFTVVAIANGLSLTYNPPANFDYDAKVTLQLSISDTAPTPNNFTYICTWQTVEDSRPPIISLISPECDSVDVSVTEPVVFSVLDVGKGVAQDSIKFSVEGLSICDGLSFDGITTSSGSGFTVTWDHLDSPFRYDSNVSVAVEAVDLSPLENFALFVCCFQTEQSQIPDFINFDPALCANFADTDTGLTFEVYGNVDGVDITTLEVRVDNKLRKVTVRPRILRSE